MLTLQPLTGEKKINIKKSERFKGEVGKRARALAMKSPNHGKHGLSKKTLTKIEAWRKAEQAIIDRTLALTNAQTMLGLGTIHVFRIDAKYESFGKVRKLVKEKPKLIADIDEIINVLDWEYGRRLDDPNRDDGEFATFYFVETKDANNSAIDSQLNRIFGKAAEKLDITSGGNAMPPVIIGMRIVDNSNRMPEENKRTFVESEETGTTET